VEPKEQDLSQEPEKCKSVSVHILLKKQQVWDSNLFDFSIAGSEKPKSWDS
jgi:hypothetical protein